jgi:hypothetical protein
MARASASTATTAESAPTVFTASAEPELAEWGKVREITVAGSGPNACETKLVREWLRVMCVPRSAELGKPVRIEIVKGRGANDRSRGENLHAVNDITTLVIPVRPGSDFEATFTWENGSRTLRASWPAGAPDSARTIAFDEVPRDPVGDEGPAPAVSGSAVPVASPSASAGLPPAEPPQDDVPGLTDPPADDAWQKAAEVRVMGSTAAGCETKIVGDWFRARCGSAEHRVERATALKGHKKTQTRITVDGGVATLVTPFVEGTETWIRVQGAEATRTLVLRWKKGPRPDTVGSFEGGR